MIIYNNDNYYIIKIINNIINIVNIINKIYNYKLDISLTTLILCEKSKASIIAFSISRYVISSI